MIETYDFKQNREVADALEAAGGVVLDRNTGKQALPNEAQAAFDALMALPRREARRMGFRGAKHKQRGHMAVPKTRGR